MATTPLIHPLQDIMPPPEEDSSNNSPTMSTTPRFSKLLTSVLGSPFLTTSDLPALSETGHMDLDSDGDLETVDGTFSAVPRGIAVTRPPSPTPSFRTDTYSLVDWTDNYDVFSKGPRPSISDAAPGCSAGFRPYTLRSPLSASTYCPYSTSTPYNTLRFSPAGSGCIKRSRSFGLLPKLLDVLRDSSPSRKGKRRQDVTSPAFWGDLDDASIDYANLPPLDGEEGELIDDEACFIDVRAVTGLDIIALLPDELALHVLSFLDLQDVLACLGVSRIWRRVAEDNALWRDLYRRRKVDGWDVDLRRAAKNTPASLFASSHGSGPSFRSIPASLALDWYDMYRTRAELDRRWSATPSIGMGISVEDKENAKLWEPTVRRITGHTDSVYCLEFDSSKIITGSRDRTIKVWSIKTGKCLATFSGHRGSVLCLKFDRDWDLDDVNSLFDIDSSASSSEMELSSQHGVWRKGFMVSGSSDCSVCVWDVYSCPVTDEEGNIDLVVTAEVRGILKGHTGGVLDLRIDSKWIVSCSKDALIRVWDRSTLELKCTFTGHEGPVNAVGLQDNRVVSASGDGKMMLWDIASGERLRTFEGHDRGLACIEFKDDLIVSGSNDCKIKIWSASTGECVRTLVGHDLLVRALSFDPQSGRLVSGSYDRTVKVWDLKTGKMLREFKGCHVSHIFDVKFDCCRIVSTSHDQKIVVLDFAEGLNASLFA